MCVCQKEKKRSVFSLNQVIACGLFRTPAAEREYVAFELLQNFPDF